MSDQPKLPTMVLGGGGGLGLAIGQGIGKSLGGPVGAWIGNGVGFAVGGILAALILGFIKPEIRFGNLPVQFAIVGLAIAIITGSAVYFAGPTAGTVAFVVLVIATFAVGVLIAVINRKRSDQHSTKPDSSG